MSRTLTTLTALSAAISLTALAGYASADTLPRTSAAEAPGASGIGSHGKNLYYFMVFSDVKPGMEKEFNHWYDYVHGPVMIEHGDFIYAQRFKLSATQFIPQKPGATTTPDHRQYLIIFAIETNDIQKVITDANRRLMLPRNVPGKAINYATLQGALYEALGAPITQKEAQRRLAVETAAGRVPGPDVPSPAGKLGEGPPGLPPPGSGQAPQ